MFNPSFALNEIIDPTKRSYMMNYLAIKYLNKSISWLDYPKLAALVDFSCLSCITCKLKGVSIDDSRNLPELTHDALCAFYGELNSGNSILSKFSWIAGMVYKYHREFNKFFNTYMFIFNKMLAEKSLLDTEKKMIINEIQNLLKNIAPEYKNDFYYSEKEIKIVYDSWKNK